MTGPAPQQGRPVRTHVPLLFMHIKQASQAVRPLLSVTALMEA